MTNPHRVPELDGLRGIAALGIVFFHYSYPGIAYERFFYIGAVSLELFFVLSGFLITSIIIANYEQRKFLTNFYARRGLRIYPIYYFLILALLAMRLFRPGIFELDAIPYYLTYTQNIQKYWFGQEPPAIYPLSHTWTLAIEEQFYIIWPALICVVGRRHVALLAASFILVAIAARAYGFASWILIGRFDGFALGALLAVGLSHFQAPPRRTAVRRTLALMGSMAFAYLTIGFWLMGRKPFDIGTPDFWNCLHIFVVGIFFTAVVGLVISSAGHDWLAPLRGKAICYIGLISYGIYLYHLPVHVYFSAPLHAIGIRNSWVAIALKLAICLCIAAVSWRLIERPILTLKDRFSYRKLPQDKPISTEGDLAENLDGGSAPS